MARPPARTRVPAVLTAALLALAAAMMMPLAAAQPADGEVAFAAPPAPEGSLDARPISCANPCYVVAARWPFRTCAAECGQDVCGRGFGTFQSKPVCCEVSFPDSGCTSRPSQCWVVESFQLRTCVRDDRKCLQGFGVYPSEGTCCAPGAAFPNGCASVPKAPQPCWVVDTYWPSRQCRESRTLCGAGAGVQTFANKSACCAPGGAFSEGCSPVVPPTPCYVVASYYPQRTCSVSSDVAVCNRGWGVFRTQEVCCAPGAGFNEGCSQPAPTAAAAPVTGPAAATAAGAAPVATFATTPLPGVATGSG